MYSFHYACAVLHNGSYAIGADPDEMPNFATFHLNLYYLKSTCLVGSSLQMINAPKPIGVASITQLRTCVIKIVTFKGGHLM